MAFTPFRPGQQSTQIQVIELQQTLLGALSGLLRLANGTWLKARNAANTADVNLIGAASDNYLALTPGYDPSGIPASATSELKLSYNHSGGQSEQNAWNVYTVDNATHGGFDWWQKITSATARRLAILDSKGNFTLAGDLAIGGSVAGKIHVGGLSNDLIVLTPSDDANPTYGLLRIEDAAGTAKALIQKNGTFWGSAITVTGGFGCNGAAAQGKYTVRADATDLATALTLVNQLRAMAIANGTAV